jgi:hypothetical protein
VPPDFQNKINQVAEEALEKIFQDIRKQVLGTSQGEHHPQINCGFLVLNNISSHKRKENKEKEKK